jgi:two-component system response regulator PilR (NtrC family)
MTRADRRGAAKATVLVVDDEADIRELLELTLIRMGLGVETTGKVAEAKELLKSGTFDLCLTDMRLPDGDGVDLVRHINANCTDIPVAVITAYGSAENAVAALKAGAFDYVSKPLSLEQLRTLVKSALSLPEKSAPKPGAGQQMLGESPPVQHVRAMIDKLARSQAPVYITGESGSGKELAARLIHENGARRDRPSCPSTAARSPRTSWRASSSGTGRVRSPGRARTGKGSSMPRRAGRCFSMKWPICRSRCR